METEQLNHDCSTLPNLAINPDVTNELLLDSEIRNDTKTILENVCSDFESMDVLSSKENKFVLLKKWKPPGTFSEYSNDGSDISNVTLDRNAECSPAGSVFSSNAASNQTDSIQTIASDENTVNSQLTTAIVVPSVDSQNQASSDIVNSVKNSRTEMVPLQDPSKVGILSDNFTNDKNLSSSLAELADAEIVQTSENAVSIIISNPRFIQVLNCKDSGLPSDTSDITLDSNCIVSEKENLNESSCAAHTHTPVPDYNLHEGNTEKDHQTDFVANEITYCEGEELYNFAHTHNTHSSTPKDRPYYRSRADLGKVAATRARRITCKMKHEWRRVLEEKGFLICPLSGCFQKYRTLANFQTHYKYCYSGMEKDLKHCPYCASVIFSSHKAVLHHMKVEHPLKLEEYKANFPQPEDGYDCFEDNSRLVEISQKSMKNHKRKFNILAKENRLNSPQKRIMKNKIKTINQPVIENSQLRSGRFDQIVSKISSVSKTQSAERDENKFIKERRKRKLILTGHVVSAEKYFEDEHDVDGTIDMMMPVEKDPPTEEKEKINTKSRLVLNMDRYKRYTEYLSVTRDFGSHRRTYSRPKSSNVLESSQLVTQPNDSSELDIHQLNSSLESSSILLNENDSLCLTENNSHFCCVSPEISAFDPLQSEATILNKIQIDSPPKTRRTEEREIDNEKSSEPPPNYIYEPIREKIPCYKAQISVAPSPKIEPVISRKPSLKISPIITYGKIPNSKSPSLKSDRPAAVDFDSLVKNSATTKKLYSVGNMHIPSVEKSKHLPLLKNLNGSVEKSKNLSVEKSKHPFSVEKSKKEDGIKHPHTHNSEFSITPGKRKRGRPRKDCTERGLPFEKRAPQPLSKNLERKKVYLSENFLQAQKGQKIVVKSKKSRKISKKSKGVMNKISSKMHSKLLQRKRRIKISAKSSLKKAIMCGVKRNKRGRPPRVCIKSLLQNSKLAEMQKKKEPEQLIYMKNPVENSNTFDHNYFSSLRICQENLNNQESQKKENLNNQIQENLNNQESQKKENLNNQIQKNLNTQEIQENLNTQENQENLNMQEIKENLNTQGEIQENLNNQGSHKENLNNSVCVSKEPSEILCTVAHKENSCNSSTEVAFSEILPVPSTLIQSVENASLTTAEDEKDENSCIERQTLSHHPPETLEQPTVSSILETGSEPPVSDQPPVCLPSQEKDSTHTPVVLKRTRGRPRKSTTPKQQTKIAPDEETPKCSEKLLVDEASSPSPLRKSERVRKRKFASPLPDEIENNYTENTTEMEKVSTRTPHHHIEQYEKTGRRGRPRKYPRIELERQKIENDSESKTAVESNVICVEKQPEEIFVCEPPQDNTPCRNTARGRRGRPRREPLNMCEKEAESVDTSELPLCVDKPNIKSKDEREEKKNSDSCSPSEKQLILPLKKRRKIEKINGVSSPKSSICDRKVSSDNGKKDVSFKMLEKEISVVLQTSTQAENDLPAVPELCMDKLSAPYKEIECAYTQKTDFQHIYPTLKPNINKAFSKKEKDLWKQYLERSVSIKINSPSSLCVSEWMKLQSFESVTLDDSKSSTFFTGGPVQSSAFCPIPSHMDQYVAVASSDIIYNRKLINSINYVDAHTKNEKGLIEVWGLGCLQSTRLNRLPRLELAFEHEFGIITQMKWCPKGCFDLPVSSDGAVGSRLGLLALSCSDSVIRVYSIPHPNILKTDGVASIYYDTSPSLKLTPLFSEPCSLTRRSIATSLDWHQNAEVIAAGYGNGCICVWMVKIILAPSATIVTVKNEDQSLSILPYLVFEASGTPVTSISFAPFDNCLYLVSSSFDKTLKFFDLRDTSMPFCSIKRGFALDDCKWCKSFCGASVSLHDGINFKGSSFAKECGTEEFPSQNIAGTVGSLTCSAISDITDMQAIADLTGTLSVNVFHSSCDQIKQPSFETRVIFETEVVTFLDKDETISLNKGVNFEVSSVLNETIDLVEIVMDEFAKCCENNSPGNLHEVISNNDKFEESITNEEELTDLMNNLLESVIVAIGTSETSLESSHTSVMLNSDSRRPDRTIENKEMPPSPSIVSTFDDVKGEGHFPDKEMLNATLPIQKKQIKNGPGSIQISNISDQLNMTSVPSSNEVICINNSVIEDASDAVPSRFSKGFSQDYSIESDCGFVLQNCVESICDIELPFWCGDSKLECSSGLQQSIESKSDCNVMTIQSVESECNAVSEKSVELESSIIPQKFLSPVESEITVVPVESECNTVIQKSIESDCSVILQLKSDADSSDISNHGEESDDSLSIISECSYASDDCDSIPSFLSDSLVPDTPSESPIPIDDKPKEEFLSPVSSSSIENKVGFSELSRGGGIPPEENCSNQPVAEESNIKIVNTEELKCNELPITTHTHTLSTENELENCILNVEKNDLNHTERDTSDPTQTFDSCNNPDYMCLLEGEEKSNSVCAVPNCLLLNKCVCERESERDNTQPPQTTNGKSSPTNCSSNDSSSHTSMLESHTDKLSSPDLFCEPQYPQTSRHFLKNVCSSEETLSTDASQKRTKLLLEESPVSYASLISTCGLIFKDVNTNNTSSERDEKKETLPIESNVLSSVNTISWNPNYGCHFWLFTAGNSGVARLICVSELSPQENTLLLDKESICDNKK